MKYMKPAFDVTEFQLNESIATCPTSSTYNPVTVNCVISGTHDIFYSNCEANYNDLTIVSYNGQEYLVWDKTNSGGNQGGGRNSIGGVSTFARPGQGGNEGDSGSSLLQAILQAGENAGILPSGGTDDASDNWGNYHAGPITPDITSTRNSSL